MLNRKVFLTPLFVGLLASSFASSQPPKGDAADYTEHVTQVAKANRRYNLPDQEAIKDALGAFPTEHFVEKTGIDQKLAGLKLPEIELYARFEVAEHDYLEILRKGKMPAPLITAQKLMLAVMRKDMVEALVRISTQI